MILSKSKHLTVDEAEVRVRNWLEREQVLLLGLGAAIGVVFGKGWEAAESGNLWLMVVLALVGFFCFAKRVQAYQRLQLSIEARDDYRKQRWEELHADEVVQLRETVSELRRELARGNPHVH